MSRGDIFTGRDGRAFKREQESGEGVLLYETNQRHRGKKLTAHTHPKAPILCEIWDKVHEQSAGWGGMGGRRAPSPPVCYDQYMKCIFFPLTELAYSYHDGCLVLFVHSLSPILVCKLVRARAFLASLFITVSSA